MKVRHYLLALLTSLLWGGNFISAKYGVDDFGIFGFSFVRAVLVGIFLVPYIKLKQIVLKDTIKIAAVYGIGFLTFINFGLLYTDNLSLTVILVQTSAPIGTVLSYLYFREKITKREAFGMFISFVGVIILVGAPSTSTSVFSIFATLVAAFSQAWQMILVRKHTKNVDTMNLLALIHILNIPLFLITAVIFDNMSLEFLTTIKPTGWIAPLYTSIASTVIGFGIWFNLLKKYSVNQVIPFMIFVPFFGVLLSVLFFKSDITSNIIFGGFTIILGLALLQFHHLFKQRAQ